MDSDVYLMASARYGTLYIGVTSNLVKRAWEHREGMCEGSSKKHGVRTLVWYEIHNDIVEAITREKQIKKWNRAWKLDMISTFNPEWRDLFDDFTAKRYSQALWAHAQCLRRPLHPPHQTGHPYRLRLRHLTMRQYLQLRQCAPQKARQQRA